ncbi:MAG: GNAT family N-acetyltransferase, partial [Candidatus Omnitrophota bacterium]|nr:GNAT family N-acetyltransferase [Candidatus Omnitrophota bacterium]
MERVKALKDGLETLVKELALYQRALKLQTVVDTNLWDAIEAGPLAEVRRTVTAVEEEPSAQVDEQFNSPGLVLAEETLRTRGAEIRSYLSAAASLKRRAIHSGVLALQEIFGHLRKWIEQDIFRAQDRRPPDIQPEYDALMARFDEAERIFLRARENLDPDRPFSLIPPELAQQLDDAFTAIIPAFMAVVDKDDNFVMDKVVHEMTEYAARYRDRLDRGRAMRLRLRQNTNGYGYTTGFQVVFLDRRERDLDEGKSPEDSLSGKLKVMMLADAREPSNYFKNNPFVKWDHYQDLDIPVPFVDMIVSVSNAVRYFMMFHNQAGDLPRLTGAQVFITSYLDLVFDKEERKRGFTFILPENGAVREEEDPQNLDEQINAMKYILGRVMSVWAPGQSDDAALAKQGEYAYAYPMFERMRKEDEARLETQKPAAQPMGSRETEATAGWTISLSAVFAVGGGLLGWGALGLLLALATALTGLVLLRLARNLKSLEELKAGEIRDGPVYELNAALQRAAVSPGLRSAIAWDPEARALVVRSADIKAALPRLHPVHQQLIVLHEYMHKRGFGELVAYVVTALAVLPVVTLHFGYKRDLWDAVRELMSKELIAANRDRARLRRMWSHIFSDDLGFYAEAATAWRRKEVARLFFEALVDDFEFSGEDLAVIRDARRKIIRGRDQEDVLRNFESGLRALGLDRRPLVKKQLRGTVIMEKYIVALGFLFDAGEGEAREAQPFIENIFDGAFTSAEGMRTTSADRSYHIWADSAVRFWPKFYIHKPAGRELRLMPGEKPLRGTAPAEIVERVESALEVLKGRIGPAEVEKIKEEIFFVGVRSPLPVFVVDSPNRVARPVHSGRHRPLFYLPVMFLYSFDRNDPAQIRELAAFLLYMWEWVSTVRVYEKTVRPEKLYEKLNAVTESFTREDPHGLASPEVRKQRLFRLMRESIIKETIIQIPHLLFRYRATYKEAYDLERQYPRGYVQAYIQRVGGYQAIRDQFKQVADRFGALGVYLEQLGDVQKAKLAFARMEKYYRVIQKSETGAEPASLQMELVTFYLRRGDTKRFLANLAMLLGRIPWRENVTVLLSGKSLWDVLVRIVRGRNVMANLRILWGANYLFSQQMFTRADHRNYLTYTLLMPVAAYLESFLVREIDYIFKSMLSLETNAQRKLALQLALDQAQEMIVEFRRMTSLLSGDAETERHLFRETRRYPAPLIRTAFFFLVLITQNVFVYAAAIAFVLAWLVPALVVGGQLSLLLFVFGLMILGASYLMYFYQSSIGLTPRPVPAGEREAYARGVKDIDARFQAESARDPLLLQARQRAQGIRMTEDFEEFRSVRAGSGRNEIIVYPLRVFTPGTRLFQHAWRYVLARRSLEFYFDELAARHIPFTNPYATLILRKVWVEFELLKRGRRYGMVVPYLLFLLSYHSSILMMVTLMGSLVSIRRMVLWRTWRKFVQRFVWGEPLPPFGLVEPAGTPQPQTDPARTVGWMSVEAERELRAIVGRFEKRPFGLHEIEADIQAKHQAYGLFHEGAHEPGEILLDALVVRAPPGSQLQRDIDAFERKYPVMVLAINTRINGRNVIVLFPKHHRSRLEILRTLIHETMAIEFRGGRLSYVALHIKAEAMAMDLTHHLDLSGLPHRDGSRRYFGPREWMAYPSLTFYERVAREAREFIQDYAAQLRAHGAAMHNCEGHAYEIKRRWDRYARAHGIAERFEITWKVVTPKIYHVWIETSEGFVIDAFPLDEDEEVIVMGKDWAGAELYRDGRPISEMPRSAESIRQWNRAAEAADRGIEGIQDSPSGFFGNLAPAELKARMRTLREGRMEAELIPAFERTGIHEAGRRMHFYRVVTQGRAPPLGVEIWMDDDRIYLSESAEKILRDHFSDIELLIVLRAVARHEAVETMTRSHDQAVEAQRAVSGYQRVRDRLELIQTLGYLGYPYEKFGILIYEFQRLFALLGVRGIRSRMNALTLHHPQVLKKFLQELNRQVLNAGYLDGDHPRRLVRLLVECLCPGPSIFHLLSNGETLAKAWTGLSKEMVSCTAVSQMTYVLLRVLGLEVLAVEGDKHVAVLIPDRAGHKATIVDFINQRIESVHLGVSYEKRGSYGALKETGSTWLWLLFPYLQIMDGRGLTALIHSNIAYALLALLEGDAAWDNTSEAIKLNPRNSAVWTAHGFAAFRVHRDRDAKTAFQHAVRLNPSNYEAHNGLGLVFGAMGDVAKSFNALARSREIRAAIAARAYKTAFELRKTGRWTRARATLRTIYWLRPEWFDNLSGQMRTRVSALETELWQSLYNLSHGLPSSELRAGNGRRRLPRLPIIATRIAGEQGTSLEETGREVADLTPRAVQHLLKLYFGTDFPWWMLNSRRGRNISVGPGNPSEDGVEILMARQGLKFEIFEPGIEANRQWRDVIRRHRLANRIQLHPVAGGNFADAGIRPDSVSNIVALSVFSYPNIPHEAKRRMAVQIARAMQWGGYIALGWYNHLHQDPETSGELYPGRFRDEERDRSVRYIRIIRRALKKRGLVLEKRRKIEEFHEFVNPSHDWIVYQVLPFAKSKKKQFELRCQKAAQDALGMLRQRKADGRRARSNRTAVRVTEALQRIAGGRYTAKEIEIDTGIPSGTLYRYHFLLRIGQMNRHRRPADRIVIIGSDEEGFACDHETIRRFVAGHPGGLLNFNDMARGVHMSKSRARLHKPAAIVWADNRVRKREGRPEILYGGYHARRARSREKIRGKLPLHPGGRTTVAELVRFLGVSAKTWREYGPAELGVDTDRRLTKGLTVIEILEPDQVLPARNRRTYEDAARRIEAAVRGFRGKTLSRATLAVKAGVSEITLTRHKWWEIVDRVKAERRAQKRRTMDIPQPWKKRGAVRAGAPKSVALTIDLGICVLGLIALTVGMSSGWLGALLATAAALNAVNVILLVTGRVAVRYGWWELAEVIPELDGALPGPQLASLGVIALNQRGRITHSDPSWLVGIPKEWQYWLVYKRETHVLQRINIPEIALGDILVYLLVDPLYTLIGVLALSRRLPESIGRAWARFHSGVDGVKVTTIHVIDSGRGGETAAQDIRRELSRRVSGLSGQVRIRLHVYGKTIGGLDDGQIEDIFRGLVRRVVWAGITERDVVCLACNTFAAMGGERIVREMAKAAGISDEKIIVITPVSLVVERLSGISASRKSVLPILLMTNASARSRTAHSYWFLLRAAGFSPREPASSDVNFGKRDALIVPSQRLVDAIQSRSRHMEKMLRLLARQFRGMSLRAGKSLNVICLSCTHYRLIEDRLNRILRKNNMGNYVIVDSNREAVAATVERVEGILSQDDREIRPLTLTGTYQAGHRFFKHFGITMMPDWGIEIGFSPFYEIAGPFRPIRWFRAHDNFTNRQRVWRAVGIIFIWLAMAVAPQFMLGWFLFAGHWLAAYALSVLAANVLAHMLFNLIAVLTHWFLLPLYVLVLDVLGLRAIGNRHPYQPPYQAPELRWLIDRIFAILSIPALTAGDGNAQDEELRRKLAAAAEALSQQLPLENYGYFRYHQRGVKDPAGTLATTGDPIAEGCGDCQLFAYRTVKEIERQGIDLKEVKVLIVDLPVLYENSQRKGLGHVLVEVGRGYKTYILGVTPFEQTIFGRTGYFLRRDYEKAIPFVVRKEDLQPLEYPAKDYLAKVERDYGRKKVVVPPANAGPEAAAKTLRFLDLGPIVPQLYSVEDKAFVAIGVERARGGSLELTYSVMQRLYDPRQRLLATPMGENFLVKLRFPADKLGDLQSWLRDRDPAALSGLWLGQPLPFVQRDIRNHGNDHIRGLAIKFAGMLVPIVMNTAMLVREEDAAQIMARIERGHAMGSENTASGPAERIIPARERDIDRVYELSKRVPMASPVPRETIARIVRSSSEIYNGTPEVYVYVKGDDVLGYIYASVYPARNVVYIVQMAVDERHERRGIGRNLLRHVVVETGKRGYQKLFACANADAARLLVRGGFQPVAGAQRLPFIGRDLREGETILTRDASVEDILYVGMERVLLATNIIAVDQALVRGDLAAVTEMVRTNFIFNWLRVSGVEPSGQFRRAIIEGFEQAGSGAAMRRNEDVLVVACAVGNSQSSEGPKGMPFWQRAGQAMPITFDPLKEFIQHCLDVMFRPEEYSQRYQSAPAQDQLRLLEQSLMVRDVLRQSGIETESPAPPADRPTRFVAGVDGVSDAQAQSAASGAAQASPRTEILVDIPALISRLRTLIPALPAQSALSESMVEDWLSLAVSGRSLRSGIEEFLYSYMAFGIEAVAEKLEQEIATAVAQTVTQAPAAEPGPQPVPTAELNLNAGDRKKAEDWSHMYSLGRQFQAQEVIDALAWVWREFAGMLPPDARIIDIGTGEGVAAGILRAAGPGFTVHSLDLADIPAALIPAGVTFHRMRAEDLGSDRQPAGMLANPSAVVSHYGWEYTNREQTLAAINRVLPVGGKVRFLVHHKNSAIVVSATVRVEEEKIIRQTHLREATLTFLQTPSATEIRGVLQSMRSVREFLTSAIREAGWSTDRRAFEEVKRHLDIWEKLERGTPIDRAAEIRDLMGFFELCDVRYEISRVLLGQAAVYGDEDRQALIDLMERHGFRVNQLRHAKDPLGRILAGWLLDMEKVRGLEPQAAPAAKDAKKDPPARTAPPSGQTKSPASGVLQARRLDAPWQEAREEFNRMLDDLRGILRAAFEPLAGTAISEERIQERLEPRAQELLALFGRMKALRSRMLVMEERDGTSHYLWLNRVDSPVSGLAHFISQTLGEALDELKIAHDVWIHEDQLHEFIILKGPGRDIAVDLAAGPYLEGRAPFAVFEFRQYVSALVPALDAHYSVGARADRQNRMAAFERTYQQERRAYLRQQDEIKSQSLMLIAPDSALAALGEGLHVAFTEFYVSQQDVREGYWETELPLTQQETQRIERRETFPISNEDGRPLPVRLVMHGRRAVVLAIYGIKFKYLPDHIRKESEPMILDSILRAAAEGVPQIEEVLRRNPRAMDRARAQMRNEAVSLLFPAFPVTSGQELEVFKSATDWVNATHRKNSVSGKLFLDFTTGIPSLPPIIDCEGVCAPTTPSSLMFYEGIRPKPGERILILGTGSGADALITAARAEGRVEIVAVENDLVSYAFAKYNVGRSPYASVIRVVQADLFDLPDDLPDMKFDRIYFNMPYPVTGAVEPHMKVFMDQDMKLLHRVLSQAGRFLKPGGTLELTYNKMPAFFVEALERGWDVAVVEGVQTGRRIMGDKHEDVMRVILKPAKNQDDRPAYLAQWKHLAGLYDKRIKKTRRGPETGSSEQWTPADESMARGILDYNRGKPGLDEQLLYESAYDILTQFAPSRRMDIPNRRVHESYREEFPVEVSPWTDAFMPGAGRAGTGNPAAFPNAATDPKTLKERLDAARDALLQRFPLGNYGEMLIGRRAWSDPSIREIRLEYFGENNCGDCAVTGYYAIDELVRQGVPLSAISVSPCEITQIHRGHVSKKAHQVLRVHVGNERYVFGISVFDHLIFGGGAVSEDEFMALIEFDPADFNRRQTAEDFKRNFPRTFPHKLASFGMPLQEFWTEHGVFISSQAVDMRNQGAVLLVYQVGILRLNRERRALESGDFYEVKFAVSPTKWAELQAFVRRHDPKTIVGILMDPANRGFFIDMGQSQTGPNPHLPEAVRTRGETLAYVIANLSLESPSGGRMVEEAMAALNALNPQARTVQPATGDFGRWSLNCFIRSLVRLGAADAEIHDVIRAIEQEGAVRDGVDGFDGPLIRGDVAWRWLERLAKAHGANVRDWAERIYVVPQRAPKGDTEFYYHLTDEQTDMTLWDVHAKGFKHKQKSWWGGERTTEQRRERQMVSLSQGAARHARRSSIGEYVLSYRLFLSLLRTAGILPFPREGIVIAPLNGLNLLLFECTKGIALTQEGSGVVHFALVDGHLGHYGLSLKEKSVFGNLLAAPRVAFEDIGAISEALAGLPDGGRTVIWLQHVEAYFLAYKKTQLRAEGLDEDKIAQEADGQYRSALKAFLLQLTRRNPEIVIFDHRAISATEEVLVELGFADVTRQVLPDNVLANLASLNSESLQLNIQGTFLELGGRVRIFRRSAIQQQYEIVMDTMTGRPIARPRKNGPSSLNGEQTELRSYIPRLSDEPLKSREIIHLNVHAPQIGISELTKSRLERAGLKVVEWDISGTKSKDEVAEKVEGLIRAYPGETLTVVITGKFWDLCINEAILTIASSGRGAEILLPADNIEGFVPSSLYMSARNPLEEDTRTGSGPERQPLSRILSFRRALKYPLERDLSDAFLGSGRPYRLFIHDFQFKDREGRALTETQAILTARVYSGERDLTEAVIHRQELNAGNSTIKWWDIGVEGALSLNCLLKAIIRRDALDQSARESLVQAFLQRLESSGIDMASGEINFRAARQIMRTLGIPEHGLYAVKTRPGHWHVEAEPLPGYRPLEEIGDEEIAPEDMVGARHPEKDIREFLARVPSAEPMLLPIRQDLEREILQNVYEAMKRRDRGASVWQDRVTRQMATTNDRVAAFATQAQGRSFMVLTGQRSFSNEPSFGSVLPSEMQSLLNSDNASQGRAEQFRVMNVGRGWEHQVHARGSLIANGLPFILGAGEVQILELADSAEFEQAKETARQQGGIERIAGDSRIYEGEALRYFVRQRGDLVILAARQDTLSKIQQQVLQSPQEEPAVEVTAELLARAHAEGATWPVAVNNGQVRAFVTTVNGKSFVVLKAREDGEDHTRGVVTPAGVQMVLGQKDARHVPARTMSVVDAGQ